MTGWLSSADSGPLTWMLSNATLIAWIKTSWIGQHQRTGRLRRRRRGPNREREKEKRNENAKLTSVYVDDQGKALRFYTEALGFAKKADFSQGPFRWLTVASPEKPARQSSCSWR